ncbi:hypothetical protein D3C87_1478610 [compost metagenome]
MIQVAEELVETVVGRQVLVAVTQVVLAELPGGVAQRLEQLGDGRVFRLQAHGGTGNADLGQAGAYRMLAGDEGRAPCRATLLAVIVGEHHAFLGQAVDIGRLVAHEAVAVAADVGDADVVTKNNQNVRLVRGHRLCRQTGCQQGERTAPALKPGAHFHLQNLLFLLVVLAVSVSPGAQRPAASMHR